MPDKRKSEILNICRELAKDRYQQRCFEMAAYLGHEVDFQDDGIPLDIQAALEKINRDSHLRLDDIDIKILTLVLDRLSVFGKRFGDEKYITKSKGENSTTHAIMSVILSDRLFEASAIVKPGEIEKLKRFSNLGVLIHDAGEALGEFSTNNMHFTNEFALKQQEDFSKNEAEYLVLRYVLYHAAYAAQTGTTEAIDRFYKDMTSMSETLGIIDAEKKPTGLNLTPEKMREFEQKLDISNLPKLNPTYAAKMDLWMGVWHLAEYGTIHQKTQTPEYNNSAEYRDRVDSISDRVDHYRQVLTNAELLPKESTFAAHFIKAVDKIQGSRHFSKFAEKTKKKLRLNIAVMPLDRVQKQLSLTEKSTANLFVAESESRHQDYDKLARTTAALVYETCADICKVIPPLPIPDSQEKEVSTIGKTTKALAKREAIQDKRLAQHWWEALYLEVKKATLLGDFVPKSKQYIWDYVSNGKEIQGITIPPAPAILSPSISLTA